LDQELTRARFQPCCGLDLSDEARAADDPSDLRPGVGLLLSIRGPSGIGTNKVGSMA